MLSQLYHCKRCVTAILFADGEDELYDCNNITILATFRCSKITKFVFHNYLIDGEIDCPDTFDDELLVLFNHECRQSLCECVGFAVTCTNPGVIPILAKWTKYLHVEGDLHNATAMFNVIANVEYLIILHLNDMNLQAIPRNTLAKLKYVTIVDLSHNKIKSLAFNSWNAEAPIALFYIQDNLLKSFQTNAFNNFTRLGVLYMSNNLYKPNDILENIFAPLTSLRQVSVTHEDICCLITSIECTADIAGADIVGSCRTILAYDSIQYILATYIVLNVVANAVAFTVNIKDSHRGISAKHILMSYLNIADGLISVIMQQKYTHSIRSYKRDPHFV